MLQVNRISKMKNYPNHLCHDRDLIQTFFEPIKIYSLIIYKCIYYISGIMLGMGTANKRSCHNETSSLIRRDHTQNDPSYMYDGICLTRPW